MTEHPAANGTGRIPADTLSNRIVLARRLAGMTIEEAAEATGLSKSSWANWENGMRPQRETDVIQTIAVALDVDRNWLMFGGPLTPARGKPTKRAGRVAGKSERPGLSAAPNYLAEPEVGERPGSVTATYPNVGESPASGAERKTKAAVRPSDTRPKVRTDPSRSKSSSSIGRRAAPVW